MRCVRGNILAKKGVREASGRVQSLLYVMSRPLTLEHMRSAESGNGCDGETD